MKMNELWTEESKRTAIFVIDNVRDTQTIEPRSESELPRKFIVVELKPKTQHDRLTLAMNQFKTLFVRVETDEAGEEIYRGTHANLFRQLEDLGEEAEGKEIEVTIAKIRTSVPFKAVRRNTKTGEYEVVRNPQTNDALLANGFDIVMLEGEYFGITDLVEARIRRIIREKELCGGGFITAFTLDSADRIVSSSESTDGSGTKQDSESANNLNQLQ